MCIRDRRKKKYADSEIEHVKKVCEDEIQNDWEALFSDARNDLNVLLKRIKALSQSKDGLCLYGNRNFYLGQMCIRDRVNQNSHTGGDEANEYSFT